jgi:hypothetical protein
VNGDESLACDKGRSPKGLASLFPNMLFLLNDVLFSLNRETFSLRLGARDLRKLTFPAIIKLGQELYAEDPLLQKNNPDRARRLGSLIASKVPMINAALFVAPRFGCTPDEVNVRFVNAEFELMAEFYTRQRDGLLDTVGVDKRLWRRLAA